MGQKVTVRYLALLGALGALCQTTVSEAADDGARACIAAHMQGQVERSAGHLLAARQQFLACSGEGCPLVVRQECMARGERVSEETPSITLVAVDSLGRDLPIASATIDAVRSFDRGFGMAIEVDPGSHRIEFRLADGRIQEKSFIVRAGERLRPVSAAFVARSPAPSPTPSPLRSVAPYLLGGVGLVALGSFVYFGLDGRSRERTLEECKPHCTQAGVDGMRHAYLAADLSLSVSLIAFGVDAYLLLNTPSPAATATGSTQPRFGIGAAGRF